MRLRNGKVVGQGQKNDEEEEEMKDDQEQLGEGGNEESKGEATNGQDGTSATKESRTEAIIKVMRQTLTEEEE